MGKRLELGPEAGAVLTDVEAARVREVSHSRALRCVGCGASIAPGSAEPLAVGLVQDGDRVTVAFAHASCPVPPVDLAELATAALADPRGIAYVQALHPDAGATLLWERRLKVLVSDAGPEPIRPHVGAFAAGGFQRASGDEPVQALSGWRLDVEGADLVLRAGEEVAERFAGGAEAAPEGWLEALRASGYGLLIVGSEMALETPSPAAIGAAIRSGDALLGLVELGSSTSA